ncbi:hypothetical protein [Roseibium sp.]|uniref:hypothetical protein n=1 Tax=Roseibium sp. TaxID=1936156 RepID=UPI003B5123E7
MKHLYLIALLGVLCATVSTAPDAVAEDCDATCLAKRAQDPLANVKALMTDNAVALRTGRGNDKPAYNFQLQPVYSIPTESWTFIPRGIIPIVGAPGSAGIPKLGTEPVAQGETKWGLGDSIFQLFMTPKTDGDFKIGFGPQVGLKTHTNKRSAGHGWGGGLVGIAFGNAGNLAYGGIVNHMWGEDGFSLSGVQPMIMYNFESIPGLYVGYNNSITYDWNAKAGDRWQVPLGAMIGKTIPIGTGGQALDLQLGAYGMAAKPTGGADAEVRFGVSMFF